MKPTHELARLRVNMIDSAGDMGVLVSESNKPQPKSSRQLYRARRPTNPECASALSPDFPEGELVKGADPCL